MMVFSVDSLGITAAGKTVHDFVIPGVPILWYACLAVRERLPGGKRVTPYFHKNLCSQLSNLRTGFVSK